MSSHFKSQLVPQSWALATSTTAAMGSLWIPDTYKTEVVTQADINLASIAWGFTLGFGFLTSVKAASQTIKIWRRTKSVTVYVILAWGELLVSTIFSFICWLFLDRAFKPSFAFFFSILTLWALQVQFLLQIIINRIALLIPDKRRVWRIKWGVAALITAINISVYCIWVPARLQINDEYIHINEVWDRCEKGIYLIVDGFLNWYFLRLVKTKLISAGITKYQRLYNFNAAIVGVSLLMDVLIIAMMSLPNTFVYMQFHPVAYIVKLNIEMSMAELITKVAKDKNGGNSDPYSAELSRITWNKSGKPTHAGHSRIRSGQYAEDRLEANRNGRMDWALRSNNGTYQTHVQGDFTPQQAAKDGSTDKHHDDSVFDDSHETRHVDFADMLKAEPYRSTSNNEGVIHVVKTVEVTAEDGLGESSSSSDTDESTRKLGV